MEKLPRPAERHLSSRVNWLRAAVLGANDGIVSVAAIIVGVAAAHSTRSAIVTAGWPGLSPAPRRWQRESTSRSAHRLIRNGRTSLSNAESSSTTRTASRPSWPRFIRERGLSRQFGRGRRQPSSVPATILLAVHARDELGMTALLPRPAVPGGGRFGGLVHGWRGSAVTGGDPCSRLSTDNAGDLVATLSRSR